MWNKYTMVEVIVYFHEAELESLKQARAMALAGRVAQADKKGWKSVMGDYEKSESEIKERISGTPSLKKAKANADRSDAAVRGFFEGAMGAIQKATAST